MNRKDYSDEPTGTSTHDRSYKLESYEQPLITWRDHNPGITKTQEILQYLLSALSGLLLLRFVLALFGANERSSFVSAIYSVTRPLVEPFTSLFPFQNTSGIARFEIETLFAIIVYIIGGLFIIRLLDIFRHKTPLTTR